MWWWLGFGEAGGELVDDGVDVGGPGAVGVSAKGFDPEEFAGAGGAVVDFELEDGFVGGADVDAVLAGGDDVEGEIAGMVGAGEGFAEAGGELFELAAGESVDLGVLDGDDRGGLKDGPEGGPVAGDDTVEDAAAGGDGGSRLLCERGAGEEAGGEEDGENEAVCAGARHDSILPKRARTVLALDLRRYVEA